RAQRRGVQRPHQGGAGILRHHPGGVHRTPGGFPGHFPGSAGGQWRGRHAPCHDQCCPHGRRRLRQPLPSLRAGGPAPGAEIRGAGPGPQLLLRRPRSHRRLHRGAAGAGPRLRHAQPDAGGPPGAGEGQAAPGHRRAVCPRRPLSRRPVINPDPQQQGNPMSDTTPRLATDGQIAMERLALAMFERPEVRAAREEARKLLLADPAATSKDGAAGLDRALDQWVMGQIASIINADPSRPVLFWSVDNTPRQWCGHLLPGAAVAIDNPDNVNRVAPLDGAWRYELRGRFGDNPTAQMNINVTLAADGQLRWGDAIATFTNRDIVADAEGRFTVTLDKSPAAGRPNHMELVDGPLQLAIRDSHGDWRQDATDFSLVVVGGPDPLPPKSDDQLSAEIAAGLIDFVKFWVGFKNSFWDNPAPNRLIGPFGRAREGGWGTQAGGRFRLADDQALVITTDSGGSDYTGFQVSDPWMISPTPLHRTTSRNIAQCIPNPDGTV